MSLNEDRASRDQGGAEGLCRKACRGEHRSGRPPENACVIEASDPELHAYASESWFTAEGSRRKLRRLQKAGLPEFKNWRFVTLTMANHGGDP
jgi:hypothetical protein